MEDPGRSQARQALGRSRGGRTTKVHLAIDGCGLPLSIVLTPGNTNDGSAFAQALDQIRVGKTRKSRLYRSWPDQSEACLQWLAANWSGTPAKED